MDCSRLTFSRYWTDSLGLDAGACVTHKPPLLLRQVNEIIRNSARKLNALQV